jgi:DNA-binding NtrC family response regulator
MKILFIEDEVELSRVGVAQLEHLGHHVCAAYSIRDARRFLEREGESFDVVLSDHKLPDGWGADLLIELKEQMPRLRSAIISGALTEQAIVGLQIAEIPYFRKPLIYSKVLRDLRELSFGSAGAACHATKQAAQQGAQKETDAAPGVPQAKQLNPERTRALPKTKKGLTRFFF